MAQGYEANCFQNDHVVQVDMAQVEENIQALHSSQSGTSVPSNVVAGSIWLDTTNDILKMYDGATWLSIWDTSNNKPVITNLSDEITLAMISSAIKDAATSVASLRTLGTGALQAAAGNDSRFSTIPDDYVTQAKMADDSVGHAELKLVGSIVQTTTIGAYVTLPGGLYGFTPALSRSTTGATVYLEMKMVSVSTSYVSEVFLTGASGVYARAYQVYVQASPPYKIGSQDWGHFLFILRNKADKKIISMYEAEDPPWAYNGPEWNEKDSKERIQEVPHPFSEYHHEDLPADLEIVLTDLRDIDIKQLKKDAHKNKKEFADEILKLNPAGKTKSHVEFNLPGITGFTDKIKIKR